MTEKRKIKRKIQTNTKRTKKAKNEILFFCFSFICFVYLSFMARRPLFKANRFTIPVREATAFKRVEE